MKRWGKALLRSMHPAQMIKSHKLKDGNKVPAITVAPYFFASMTDEKSPIRPVWPKDGAIISPIFLLAKSKNKDKVKPFVDLLYSKEIGDILSSNGKFPIYQSSGRQSFNARTEVYVDRLGFYSQQ